MMLRKSQGFLIPFLTAGLVVAAVWMVSPQPYIRRGILVGLIIALAQSYASTGALLWAWNKHFFYWAWGGGVLFRMVVFALTASVVYRFTYLSLVATMATLVSATTFFLVIESVVFFSKPT